MAEVLTPFSTPSSTITMLHSRPSSSDAFNGSSQQYSASPRAGGQQSRSMYNGQNSGYRNTSAAPVQPYAFQSTPTLRQDARSVPNPSVSHAAIATQKHAHAHTQSVSTSSTSTTSDSSSLPSAKDDSVIGSKNSSLINLSSSVPDLSLTNFDQQPKPSPDRYRRPAQKKTESGANTPRATTPQPVTAPAPSYAAGAVQPVVQQQQQSQADPPRRGSVDDITVKSGNSELAKRYRRRSMNTIDTSTLQAAPGAAQGPAPGHVTATSTQSTIRPVSRHERSGSDDSQVSQSRREPASTKNATGLRPEGVNLPPRTSSEATKRAKAPSPLSRQTGTEQTPQTSPQKPKTYAAAAQAGVHAQQSAAAQQLAAVSDKDLNKGMKSRLRRAFSFGSAQELRRSAAENSEAAYTQDAAAQQAQHAREQHKQHIDEELDAEQQEIARKQEAGGLGNSIYANTSVALTGSTDNISISSTASSASMMLRKMGRGAKKSARSIKGLFRPKSVIGVPAADGPVSTQTSGIAQPSVAQVSMVSVEAERQKVNVDAHPSEKHGVTGFPKLERNSIDAANSIGASPARASGDRADSLSRRSIVGSDKERAEVLAAVKKGILKRSGTASPNASPVIKPADGSESPASSMPSTPKDGQSRTDSMKNTNGDYFSTRMVSMAKSMPNTPNGSRNISFSPRIQFHDVWSSTEYDRRGEIATCNRLTPLLAQQIKEELNTFKMEMEVHESSKPHTHFF